MPNYIVDRMNQELYKQPRDSNRICLLVYLSYMFRFHELKRFEFNNLKNLYELLSDIPKPVIDSLLKKFTELSSDTDGRYKNR
jgi:hypothetical protein